MANRVANGDFESGITGWEPNFQDETLSHETGAPLAGTGSLKVVTDELDYAKGTIYDPSPTIAVTAGEMLRLTWKAKGDGRIAITGDFSLGPQTEFRIDTYTGTAQDFSLDFTVPEGATELYLAWYTPTDDPQAVTFYLDNVVLDLVPDTTPPASPAVVAALAARAGRGWGRGRGHG